MELVPGTDFGVGWLLRYFFSGCKLLKGFGVELAGFLLPVAGGWGEWREVVEKRGVKIVPEERTSCRTHWKSA